MRFSHHILMLLFLCSVGASSNEQNNDLIDAVIIGSAESPDPVLQRVLELQRDGFVSDVIVMESFPVQIRLKATEDIIKELESIPRVKSEAFN